jgi:hypothetical protein
MSSLQYGIGFSEAARAASMSLSETPRPAASWNHLQNLEAVETGRSNRAATRANTRFLRTGFIRILQNWRGPIATPILGSRSISGRSRFDDSLVVLSRSQELIRSRRTNIRIAKTATHRSRRPRSASTRRRLSHPARRRPARHEDASGVPERVTGAFRPRPPGQRTSERVIGDVRCAMVTARPIERIARYPIAALTRPTSTLA